MTEGARKRLIARHLLAGGAVLLVLIGFGQTWATITLQTGQTVTVSGSEQAAIGVSLLLVTGAAHALSLIVYGGTHLATVLVQLLSALGATWATIGAVGLAVERARVEITQLTGLSGREALDELVVGVALDTVATGLSIAGVILFTLSALLGLSVKRVRHQSTSRFELPRGQEDQNPWDELSDGGDPTTR